MKIEIKSRFDESVLFSIEADSFKLVVEAAVKSGADLSGADMCGADLSGKILDKNEIQILGTAWPILLNKKNIRIGCKFHSVEEWFNFDDDRIAKMHSKALDWWKIWKPILKLVHEGDCK